METASVILAEESTTTTTTEDKKTTRCFLSREEGNAQESIQSITIIPDPEHNNGKVTKHKKTQHAREPIDQPFTSRYSKGCKEHTSQHKIDKHENDPQNNPTWLLKFTKRC